MANHNQERERYQNKEEMKELEARIREQDTRLSSLQSSGFQLANLYFVFQGVILSAIVNGNSSLRCSDRWFLISLSLLAAVLNLFSLYVIGRNFLRSYVQRDKTWDDYNTLYAFVNNSTSSNPRSSPSASTQLAGSEDTISRRGESNQAQSTIKPGDTWEENKRTVYFGICLCFFGCFAIIMVVGCSIILCRKKG